MKLIKSNSKNNVNVIKIQNTFSDKCCSFLNFPFIKVYHSFFNFLFIKILSIRMISKGSRDNENRAMAAKSLALPSQKLIKF